MFARKKTHALFFLKLSQNSDVLALIADKNLMREYTNMSSVDILSIRVSNVNISFSIRVIEIINFGRNPIKGGTLPSIAIDNMIMVVCFFAICVFTVLDMNLINMATITV